MIHQGVAQLFFFDGEKIQQLAEEASDQQALGEAIKSLLGLEVVERLQTDLGIYLARLTKVSQDRKLADEVEGLQQEMASIQERLNALRGQREQCENRLSELRSAIAKVEAKIASEGGSFTRNRDSLVQQQAHLKTRISQRLVNMRNLHDNCVRHFYPLHLFHSFAISSKISCSSKSVSCRWRPASRL